MTVKEKLMKDTKNDWNHVYGMEIIDWKTTLICVGVLCLPLIAVFFA